MNPTVEEIVRQALALSDEERAEVAARILESLETRGAEEADAAWVKELERREAEMESGAVEGVSWEVVQERLLQRSRAG